MKNIIKWFLDLFKTAPKTETTKEPDQENPHIIVGMKTGIDKYTPGTLAYIDAGLKLVGNKEIPGKDKNNPVIVQFFIDVVGKKYTDETAHCMAFVQAMLKRTGFKWLATLWAADADNKWQSWLTKKDLSKIAVGDVATKFSSVANSGRHVFFILAVDHDKKRVLVLESNASNMVKNTNWYPFDILRFCGTPIKK